MDFVASYLLCVENKLEPSKANITMLLKAASASIDATELDNFLSKTNGKSHEEIISAGAAMMTLQKASTSSAPVKNTPASQAAPESEAESSDEAEISFF